MFVGIEGNIVAGKTTVAKELSRYFGVSSLLERFKDNPINNQSKYAFKFEMSLMVERYYQLKKQANNNIYKSLIFAKLTLGKEELKLFKKYFNILLKEIPKNDVIFFLQREIIKKEEEALNKKFQQNFKIFKYKSKKQKSQKNIFY